VLTRGARVDKRNGSSGAAVRKHRPSQPRPAPPAPRRPYRCRESAGGGWCWTLAAESAMDSTLL
jgi:hypothetical protein